MSPKRANSNEPVEATGTCQTNRSLLSLAHNRVARPRCLRLLTHDILLAGARHRVLPNGTVKTTIAPRASVATTMIASKNPKPWDPAGARITFISKNGGPALRPNSPNDRAPYSTKSSVRANRTSVRGPVCRSFSSSYSAAPFLCETSALFALLKSHFHASVSPVTRHRSIHWHFIIIESPLLHVSNPHRSYAINHELRIVDCNPKVELCYLDERHDQIRITGIAEVLTDRATLEAIWEENPLLRKYLGTIDNPQLVIYRIRPTRVRYMQEWALEYYEVPID